MSLQGVPFDAPPHMAADWLELRAATNPSRSVLFVDIERGWEAQRISEDTDFEDESSEFDDFLNPALECIARRANILGPAYPFILDDDSRELRVRTNLAELSVGELVYYLCLILTAIPESELLANAELTIPDKVRDRFQACATWAAAGFINGSAHTFGWPRADRTGLIEACARVHQELMADGEARVRGAALEGASGHEKDDGIDVIAWTPRIDNACGKVYLLGQVATGKNWRNKTVRSYIDAYHDHWFDQAPVSACLPSMFIPFSIVPAANATIEGQLRFWAAEFGAIFYRDVLPRYAEMGYELGRSGRFHVDRMGDKDEISRYVVEFITQLANSAAAQSA